MSKTLNRALYIVAGLVCIFCVLTIGTAQNSYADTEYPVCMIGEYCFGGGQEGICWVYDPYVTDYCFCLGEHGWPIGDSQTNCLWTK